MTSRPIAVSSSLVLALLALPAGCGAGATPGTDAASGSDAGSVIDAGSTSDTGTTTGDAGTDAASGSDTGATDDAALARDSGGGADTGSTIDAFNTHDAAAGGDADIAACSYVAVDEVVVLCGADYVFVSHFTSDAPRCPPFYAFDPDGAHFPNTAAAIASDATCDASCEWHFATSVTRLYCGHRTGYETLSATGCADVYRFAEGYYPSVEAHDAANPCP